MKIKKISEEITSFVPDKMPSDEELAVLYPDEPDARLRRVEYNTDHFKKAMRNQKNINNSRDEDATKREEEEKTKRQDELNKRNQEKEDVDNMSLERDRFLDENIRIKREILSRLGNILTTTLNNKDKSFYDKLNGLLNNYNANKLPNNMPSEFPDNNEPFMVEKFLNFKK